MTTITIERARIEEWFEALSTAKNGLLWFIDSYPQDVNGCDDEAMSEIDMTLEAMSAALAADHALREQVQPEKAFVCSLGCTTECIARQHGVPSECPSLPRQPTQPATAPEPVAWLRAGAGLYCGYQTCEVNDENGFPVYRHPPATAPAWHDAQQAEIESLRWTVKDALESLDNGMTADCRATLSSATKETP